MVSGRKSRSGIISSGDDADSSKVIYLGEVRRRRQPTERRAPDRHYVAALVGIGFVSLGVWLIVLLTLPPQRLLTFVAFLAPLWLAVTSMGSAALYGWSARGDGDPSIRACVRRGGLFSTFVVGTLALLAGRRWTVPAEAILVIVLLAAESLALRRHTRSTPDDRDLRAAARRRGAGS